MSIFSWERGLWLERGPQGWGEGFGDCSIFWTDLFLKRYSLHTYCCMFCVFCMYSIFTMKVGIKTILGGKVPLLRWAYSHLCVMPEPAKEGGLGRIQLKTKSYIDRRDWSWLLRDVPQPGSPSKMTQQRETAVAGLGPFSFVILVELLNWLSKVVLAIFHIIQISDYNFQSRTLWGCPVWSSSQSQLLDRS